MNDKINFIDGNGKLDHEELYKLLKTHSSKTNKKISEKIDIFKHNLDFFEFYSNKEIKKLLNIFKLKLSENNDEYFSSFKSHIDQYISCMCQIILSIKLFLKTQDTLSKIVISAKNHLSKLKYEKKIENHNQNNLFSYLESLLIISEKNSKIFSSASTLSSNISSIEVPPKNSIFRGFSSEYNINRFSKNEIELKIIDRPPTPRFELESKSDENIEKNNSNLDNSIESYSTIKKESVLTLSKYVFIEEPITPKNPESKLIKPPKIESKIKQYSTKERVPLNENMNKRKNGRSLFSNTNIIIKKNDKNYYMDLLEMINKIYKNGLINSEEKIKLKQLVIEKSKKIEYLYYNIYKNAKNDKNTLITEVKKILN